MSTRDLATFQKQIEDFSREVPGILRKLAVRAAIEVEREAKFNATRRVLKKRSGALARSINAKARVTAEGSHEVVARSEHISSSTHEHGAVIRPKRAKMLAIPLAAAKTAGGVARYSTPRSVPGLFVLKSKAGNLLLVKREGGGITPYFVLKHSVTIPRRPFLRPAVVEVSRRVPALLTESVLRYYNARAARDSKKAASNGK